MMNISDLIIHINEKLDPTKRTALEDMLRTRMGVIAPRFNRETPQLLFVSYNPSVTGSSNLLSHVSANGYSAQLVGM